MCTHTHTHTHTHTLTVVQEHNEGFGGLSGCQMQRLMGKPDSGQSQSRPRACRDLIGAESCHRPVRGERSDRGVVARSRNSVVPTSEG